MDGTKKSGGTRGASWRERETLDLISFWGQEKVQEALRQSHRNIDIFEKIADQMAARGHHRSAVECRTKTKLLRKEYRKFQKHNNQSGNSSAICPFYYQLRRILRPGVSTRPKRLARNLNLPAEEEEQNPSVEGMGGSEELFNSNVMTMECEDVSCSTPEDACTVEAIPNTAESYPVLGGHLDEAMVTDNMQPGDVGDQPALPEEYTVRPSTPTLEEQGEPSDALQESPMAELSPDAQFADIRNRKRRVALLNDVARQMLRQCVTEEANANRRHEEMMAEDRRRHCQMVEEARLDRRAFQDAMQKNMDVMLAAIGALKTIGEVMLARRQGVLAQDRGQSSDPLNSHTNFTTRTTPPDNSTKTQGNVPGATANKCACTGPERAPTDL